MDDKLDTAISKLGEIRRQSTCIQKEQFIIGSAIAVIIVSSVLWRFLWA